MAVTIRDVAREAGVSAATVSKFLNGKPGVSAQTAGRIEAVMKRLDYAPDSRAASLARRATRSVAYLTCLPPDAAYKNPHGFDILCGVQAALAEQGYTLTLMNTADAPSPAAAAERIVGRKLADGVIFHGVPVDRNTAALLIRRRFPHIVIGRPGAASRLSWVEIDQTLGGRIAAEHLLEQGYRRIGFLTGRSDDETAYLRVRGFRIAMQEAGVPVNEAWILHAQGGFAACLRSARELLEADARPSAVICGSSLHALGLYQAARLLGLSVPEDVAAVAFDRYPYSALLDPPPTLVHIDVNDLGRTAGKMMLRRLDNPELLVQSFVTLPRLIQGGTTPPCRSGRG